MGLDARKPVLGLSNKMRFQPACSATETSQKIGNFHVAILDILSNKGIKKKRWSNKKKNAGQAVRMHRMVCAFVVCKPQKTGFSCIKAHSYMTRYEKCLARGLSLESSLVIMVCLVSKTTQLAYKAGHYPSISEHHCWWSDRAPNTVY